MEQVVVWTRRFDEPAREWVLEAPEDGPPFGASPVVAGHDDQGNDLSLHLFVAVQTTRRISVGLTPRFVVGRRRWLVGQHRVRRIDPPPLRVTFRVMAG